MVVDKPIQFTFTAENKRGIMVLPKNCTPYIIFLNNNTRFYKLHFIFVKLFLSIAETIARW